MKIRLAFNIPPAVRRAGSVASPQSEEYDSQ